MALLGKSCSECVWCIPIMCAPSLHPAHSEQNGGATAHANFQAFLLCAAYLFNPPFSFLSQNGKLGVTEGGRALLLQLCTCEKKGKGLNISYTQMNHLCIVS